MRGNKAELIAGPGAYNLGLIAGRAARKPVACFVGRFNRLGPDTLGLGPAAQGGGDARSTTRPVPPSRSKFLFPLVYSYSGTMGLSRDYIIEDQLVGSTGPHLHSWKPNGGRGGVPSWRPLPGLENAGLKFPTRRPA